MSFAVIQTGGKQYKVKEGMELKIELIPNKKEQDKLEFIDMLSKKKVIARILNSEKGKKISVYKFKNKTRYRKKMGHRQNYHKIKIESIK